MSQKLFSLARRKRTHVANVRLDDAQLAAAEGLAKSCGAKSVAQLLLLSIGFALSLQKRFGQFAAERLPQPQAPEAVDVA